MPSSTDERHKAHRQYLSPSTGELLDEVFLSLPVAEREALPESIGSYVNTLVGIAISNLSKFSEPLKRTVANLYMESPGGERFLLDSTRTTSISDWVLYLDSDGELVTAANASIKRVNSTRENIGVLILKSYSSYIVLTGRNAANRFTVSERPLPSEPTLAVASQGQSPDRVGKLPHPQQSPDVSPTRTNSRPLKVFLSHAKEDKESVRKLRVDLVAAGHEPWLDEENLLPGQDWEFEIRRAVTTSDIILVCVSTRSERKGYLQKEITYALDVACQQPEGAIFLIPVKLERCEVPARLSKWQWVDLHSEQGLQRLLQALSKAAPT